MGVKIALVAKMRAGKDSFAAPLIDRKGFCHLKFSNGIRCIIRGYFSSSAGKGKPRELYQTIGQGLRKVDPDVWVNHMEKQYNAALSMHAENIIITDVRQKNEAEWCRKNGFTLVRIEVPDEVRKQRIIDCGDQFEPQHFFHETEISLEEIEVDYVINGDCSKDHLELQAIELYEYLKQEELV